MPRLKHRVDKKEALQRLQMIKPSPIVSDDELLMKIAEGLGDITPTDAAFVFGCSVKTLMSKNLPHVRVGSAVRFSRKHLLRALEGEAA